MSRVEAAAAMDRLPWLPDEPQPQRARRRGNGVLPWAAAAIAAVACAGFFVGVKSVDEVTRNAARRAQPTTTVRLPEPRTLPPEVRMTRQPEVNSAPAPQVRPTPVRDLHVAAPPAAKSTAAADKPEDLTAALTESQAPAVVAPPAFVPPKPWNPRVFAGSAGRVVQIGAFGSTPQAKRGWWYMVRAYPAVAHLPAVVRPARNSKGRAFYRFQVGTTSQAHSEVLCQRMQRIGFSCAVVGLPWKAKVER